MYKGTITYCVKKSVGLTLNNGISEGRKKITMVEALCDAYVRENL